MVARASSNLPDPRDYISYDDRMTDELVKDLEGSGRGFEVLFQHIPGLI